MMQATLPFDPNLLKNQAKMILGSGRRKWIGLTPSYRKKMEYYTTWLTKELNGHKFTEKKKIYVSMKIYKPSNRMDAINFIDALCDIIKKAIGIDDRYYAVSCDWEIDKEKPRIEVKISEDCFSTF